MGAFTSHHTVKELNHESRQVPYLEGKDDYIKSSDGLWLYTKSWLPQGKATANIFILHGFAEYSEKYDSVAKVLNAEGYAVFCHDHQGFGRSEGDRAYVEYFADYVEEFFTFHAVVMDKHPELASLPTFIWGHSMGGLIAFYTALKAQKENVKVKGIILTCPSFKPEPKTTKPINVFLVSVLRTIVPKFAVPWEKGPVSRHPLTHDAAIQKEFEEDPICYHGGLRIRWGSEMIHKIQDVDKRLDEFAHPFLLFHGTDDKIADIQGSRSFYQKSKAADKTYKEIEGAYHELHNEVSPMKDIFLKEMKDWLKRQASA